MSVEQTGPVTREEYEELRGELSGCTWALNLALAVLIRGDATLHAAILRRLDEARVWELPNNNWIRGANRFKERLATHLLRNEPEIPSERSESDPH